MLEVLASSMTSLYLPDCSILCFILQMSCLTLSSHLLLGLSCNLVVIGFHLYISDHTKQRGREGITLFYSMFYLEFFYILLLIFFLTRFRLLPLIRPIPFLSQDFLAITFLLHGWGADPSHNPQPEGPGCLF
jgi:hypothetical protein